jgi:hypothetical protein
MRARGALGISGQPFQACPHKPTAYNSGYDDDHESPTTAERRNLALLTFSVEPTAPHGARSITFLFDFTRQQSQVPQRATVRNP